MKFKYAMISRTLQTHSQVSTRWANMHPHGWCFERSAAFRLSILTVPGIEEEDMDGTGRTLVIFDFLKLFCMVFTIWMLEFNMSYGVETHDTPSRASSLHSGVWV